MSDVTRGGTVTGVPAEIERQESLPVIPRCGQVKFDVEGNVARILWPPLRGGFRHSAGEYRAALNESSIVPGPASCYERVPDER